MRVESYDIDGKQLNLPIPENYSDCFELIRSDRYRITGNLESSIRLLLRAIKPFSNDWLFLFRLSQY